MNLLIALNFMIEYLEELKDKLIKDEESDLQIISALKGMLNGMLETTEEYEKEYIVKKWNELTKKKK